MNWLCYILQSFVYFRRQHIASLLGVALSTAILTGALIIGDSVGFSLKQITIERLGKTQSVITAGERIFTQQLAARIDSTYNINTSALLRANGMAIVDGGETRVNQLQVWGIDRQFASFSQSPESYVVSENEVLINENLASLLQLKAGDEFLLRVSKISAFPANTPFVSVEENTVSLRVKLKAVLSAAQTGNLNLQNIQSAPRNVFIDIHWLNAKMGLNGKANVILLDQEPFADTSELIRQCWSMEDVNLKMRSNAALAYTEVISDRVFIDDNTEQLVQNRFEHTEPVFSYFVNSFQTSKSETPYSFVSTLTSGIAGNEIIVNEWLARDLNLKSGDTIRVKYFEVGALRKLTQRDTMFVVKQIVPLQGTWADVNRMPDIPGLSDAGHCRDWEAGVPVDLDKIRPLDEAYWNEFKGTPKAFVSIETARKLWGNQFGKTTAIRFSFQNENDLAVALMAQLSPEKAGFQLQPIKSEGLSAASQGVDFGELFIGLSFFVLVAAVLLTVLLFRLSLNFRKNEIGTLAALGFSHQQIRKFFMGESFVIVLLGILLGIPFSILYNKLILLAVNTIWVDIVRTSIVYVHIRWQSLLIGAFAVFILSAGSVFFILRSFLKKEIKQLHSQVSGKPAQRSFLGLTIGGSLVLASLALIIYSGTGADSVNQTLFYLAGFGMLPGLILLLQSLFQYLVVAGVKGRFSTKQLLFKRLGDHRKHHLLIISFLSIGIFLVISTGMNRKDLTSQSDQPSSGTGGYAVFVETSIPFPEDLNHADVAEKNGFTLADSISFVQFRAQSGDDASCLNLNRISRPRLIGFDPEVFQQRRAFSFVAQIGHYQTDSLWSALNEPTAEGYIPAIADQTVIKWGLGKNVGDTLVYYSEKGEKLKLQLIGGLANSVFQGNVLISEKYFSENYPSVSGSSVFLADSPAPLSELTDLLKNNLRQFGPEITSGTERLLRFYQIENTYLNIFLMLGALGLLVGTFGLAILIYRLLADTMVEMAVLLALGFRKKQVFSLFFAEYAIVVGLAVLAGIIPALVSGLPSLGQEQYAGLIWWALGISLLVYVSALLWIALLTQKLLAKRPTALLRNE